ncbi:MAG TPA: hypothetical protein VHB21_22020 [Minicystis sp.]|nr:hypothetical protein [Minicystis sp.]
MASLRNRFGKRSVALAAAIGAASAGAALGACQPGLPAIETCGEIPGDGCPIGRGGTCDDPTCSALYDCVSGRWVEKQRCTPEPDAGGGGGGAGGGGGGAQDGGVSDACTPFSFDHKGEQEVCSPSLELPDCPAAAAEGCVEDACTTGCVDFFLCEKQGWVDVGYCDDDGGFHDTQP